MKICGEKVDNLAFFAMFGLLALLLWLEGKLPISNEDKALLGIVTVFIGAPIILVVMLTQREDD